MSEHTPGPWNVHEGELACFHRGNRFAITHLAHDGVEVMEPTIAEVWPVDNGTDKADAHLIAAAPDLLEALESLVNQPAWHRTLAPYERSALDKARAAVAKAKGEHATA